jgi:dipeptidyl aminopeptidase/acylaminoacyl peptidase
MIRIIVISVLFFLNTALIAQKLTIDFKAIRCWPNLLKPSISDNGKFVSYIINNRPVGSNTLVVRDINGLWVKEFILKNLSQSFFSADSRKIIFLQNDTLCFQTLGNDEISTVTSVRTFIIPNKAVGKWMAFSIGDENKTLVLLNVVNGKQNRFSSVEGFSFDNEGNALLIKSAISRDSVKNSSLVVDKLANGSIDTIWTDKGTKDNFGSVTNYNFDSNGQQLAFVVQNKKGSREENSIWYYRDGMRRAVSKITNSTEWLDDTFVVDNISPEFSRNGRYIFFNVNLLEKQKANRNAVSVDIWSYKDCYLQAQQLNDDYVKKLVTTFMASLDLQNGGVIRLEKEGDRTIAIDQAPGDYVIVADKQDVVWWNREGRQQSYFLMSLRDGSRKLIKKGTTQYFSFSPSGNFLVYFDGQSSNYYSYNISAGLSKNISNSVTVPFANKDRMSYYVPGRTYPLSFPIAGWLSEDSGILVYDNYDIWKLDPKGIRAAKNITNGFGHRHHIRFELISEDEVFKPISTYDPLLLTAFNDDDKNNGFYKKYLNQDGAPEQLTMEPSMFYMGNRNPGDAFDIGMKPVKAINSNTWIIKRQTASDAPNYFVTTDFKKFQAISNLHPDQEYNWLTSELVSWRQLDGTVSQGILYKPENFDPSKRYPIIFHYYETFSHRLYQFARPDYSEGRIDIPWYVSHGYLVFTPDIHFSVAYMSEKTVGDCAVNSVVSAAQYLSKLSYVDKSRMGIQGHSFSGGQTLYLITHSKIFIAACGAASTVSDQISAYLGVKKINGKPVGEFRLSHSEIGHDHIGATLWQRPDLYLKSSPIFKADQVVTPLLMMHNRGDGATDWEQSVEMYMALRRLEKEVWLLQYDGQDHLVDGKSAKDYSIRMTQFFDHYLKSAPAPTWMTKGIPARLKQIEIGYAYDPSGNCGKDCKVCKMWNEKMKKDSAGTWKEIEAKTKSENWMGGGEK